jgi:hypothetical protein
MMTNKKRGLPNQHERLSRRVAFGVRAAFGSCSACGARHSPAVIYRRSWHSVTFKCKACSLQWTITLANMHRAAKTQAEIWRGSDHKNAAAFVNLYEDIAMGTRDAVEDEAKRRNTITTNMDMTQLKERSVIRLGSGKLA